MAEDEPLLSRKNRLTLRRLDEALRRDLKIRIDEADRSDLFYFLHLTGYDERFPCEELLRIYRDTMAGLGIDVKTQKNILIDSEPRPHKRPRAFCMPITVPDEVMLVIRPVGGNQYQAYFMKRATRSITAGHRPSAILRSSTRAICATETFVFCFHRSLRPRAGSIIGSVTAALHTSVSARLGRRRYKQAALRARAAPSKTLAHASYAELKQAPPDSLPTSMNFFLILMMHFIQPIMCAHGHSSLGCANT